MFSDNYYERINSCVITRSDTTWRSHFSEEMAAFPLITRHDNEAVLDALTLI